MRIVPKMKNKALCQGPIRAKMGLRGCDFRATRAFSSLNHRSRRAIRSANT